MGVVGGLVGCVGEADDKRHAGESGDGRRIVPHGQHRIRLVDEQDVDLAARHRFAEAVQIGSRRKAIERVLRAVGERLPEISSQHVQEKRRDLEENGVSASGAADAPADGQ